MRNLNIKPTREPPEHLLLYPEFVLTRMLEAGPCSLVADYTLQQDGSVAFTMTARDSGVGLIIGRVPLADFRTVLARFAVSGGLENLYGGHAFFVCDFERDGMVLPHRFSMFLSNEPSVAFWLRIYLYGIDRIQNDMKPNKSCEATGDSVPS